MPLWTQAIGDLIPLTYFVRISRGIISKGIGLDLLWQDAAILLIYAVVTVVLAALVLQKEDGLAHGSPILSPSRQPACQTLFRRRKGNAVDKISLSVQRGETFGLIGPDGAGKSTTIRVILGLLKRTAGESSYFWV